MILWGADQDGGETPFRLQPAQRGQDIQAAPEKSTKWPVIIAAIVRDEQLIVPRGMIPSGRGLSLFVFKERHFGEIINFFGWQSKTLKNIMIFGGGNIGFGLANPWRATPQCQTH